MISRLGSLLSAVFRRLVPDPFVIAVLLTLLTAMLAVAFGYPDEGAGRLPLADRAVHLLDAWGPGGGLWSLLPFAMQMCLVLVTGHALAASPMMQRALAALARVPKGPAQAAAWVAWWACFAGALNWGLGLIVGAVLARETGAAMDRRGIRMHYPLLVAAGYSGLMVWHGGLSGSAPLSMTTLGNAAKVLPAGILEQLAGGPGGPDTPLIPLTRTLGSTLNLGVTGGLLVLTPLVFVFLVPRGHAQPMGEFLVPAAATAPRHEPPGGALPEWLERSPLIVLGLALALAALLWRFASASGLGVVGLNEVNAAMLAAGLVLHGSARSYVAAVEEAARGCGGIILQFPLYAGIMAMMQASGLIRQLAEGLTSMGTERTIPVLSFLAAAVVNLFVPSGGGQWAVQGPVALQAGLDAGIDPGRMVLSVAYGDQLTNMLQPFWALPLLAITGVKARDIVGYTAVVMLVAGLWIAGCLLVLG